MSKNPCFLLILSLVFATFYCQKKVNRSDIRPPRVVMVPAVSDTSRVEKGIDAVPEGNTIRVEWIPCADESVAEYEIHRREGNAPGARFVQIATVVHPDSFCLDSGPRLLVRYFYSVWAVTDDGLRSESSDTLSYMLLLKSTIHSPRGETTETKPVFSWTDNNQPHVDEYVVRVVDAVSGEPVWISVVRNNYEPGPQSVVYNADQTARLAALLLGKEYRWRVDARGQGAAGSESEWVSLKIK
jgi:hypothetical protein